jgi:hypothetical protein
MARDFDELRKLASLPTLTVSLCLAGELSGEIAELERQLADAAAPTSIGEASPKRLIAARIAELTERMKESMVDFRLRALPSREWTMLWTSMPRREEQDSATQWSERIFPFYAELISRSCVDPAMTVEQAGELADILHGNSWQTLAGACLTLNMGEVDVPNSVAASELIGTSEQT